jgi:hypothetical protein
MLKGEYVTRIGFLHSITQIRDEKWFRRGFEQKWLPWKLGL